jgi:hypothetical protein
MACQREPEGREHLLKKSCTVRAAKEFLVAEITDEASRDGLPLSEIERQMLFFSERASNGRAAADLVDRFQREHDEQAFERKIARLIRAARRRADQAKAPMWAAALERLESGDHYLLVMLDQAGLRRSKRPEWRAVIVIVAAFTVLAIFWIASDSYMENYLGRAPRREERGFFVWLAMVACGAVYTVARLLLGGDRVDNLLQRLIDACLGTRQR